MGWNRESTEPSPVRGRALALGFSVALLLSCSVYDSSLTDGSQQLPASNGGTTDGLTDAGDAGGSASSPDPTDGGGGALVDAGGGAVTLGGASAGGDSSLGNAGTTAGAAVGGASGSGGAASAGGTSSSVGGGGTAGGAGGAPLLELAKGKSVTASTQQAGNAPASGNDGDTTTRWCAIDGTFPQWWRVDLGASHALTNVAIQFEHPDRKYSYVIETSANDAVYTQQATVNGTGAVQSVDLPPAVSARYLRITVTGAVNAVDANGTVHQTWASFFELAIMGS
jgi:F5/8 type C domain